MLLEMFQYNGKNKSWSVPRFPDLDSENTLVLIFASPHFIDCPAPIQDMIRQYPQAKIIGCSTAGEIAGSNVFDNSLSVAVAKFEKTLIKSVRMPIDSPEKSFQVGQNIMSRLDSKDLYGIFVLSDGLNINGTELVNGLNSLNKPEVIITGGLAGDGKLFQRTWTICGSEIASNFVVAIGFYGQAIRISHGSRGGWDIFGPERRITRSKNNILYELDGKPALSLYKEYLGEKAQDLPSSGLLFPLAIRKNNTKSTQLVRTILGVDEEAKSLIFAGDMPVGYLAQLMRANFDRLISGAAEAGVETAQHISKINPENAPLLLVAISCVGRRLVLGERSEEETEIVLATFPKGTQQVGFYSYGELSPGTDYHCDLHNQTMTLTSISEDI